jgi:hypothetical protein
MPCFDRARNCFVMCRPRFLFPGQRKAETIRRELCPCTALMGDFRPLEWACALRENHGDCGAPASTVGPQHTPLMCQCFHWRGSDWPTLPGRVVIPEGRAGPRRVWSRTTSGHWRLVQPRPLPSSREGGGAEADYCLKLKASITTRTASRQFSRDSSILSAQGIPPGSRYSASACAARSMSAGVMSWHPLRELRGRG